MKSANVNDIKEALDFINEDVRRLAIAKEDFSLTWDTLLSEMTSLQPVSYTHLTLPTIA